MKVFAVLKFLNLSKKTIFVLIFTLIIFITGAFNYAKTQILSENEIPPQILFSLKKVSSAKNLDLFKFASAVKDRSDFGRIDLTEYFPNTSFYFPILNIIKVDLFNSYNIYNFTNFTLKRFLFHNETQNLYGVMLLSDQDIKSYGDLDPYNYENALNMFADKLIFENYFTQNTLYLNDPDTPMGFPTCCVITQKFGQVYPDEVIKRLKGLIPQFHTGLDIADSPSKITPVHSTMNGKATIGEDKCGGKFVNISNSNFKTYYGHLDSFNIRDDQYVQRGDIIGIQGKTGQCATGKHTHYEIYYKNKLVDPEKFL